ncbi:MAG: VCBS repeat-containing protein [Desulfovibrionales bacterium]|nr:VCBS repeat-containing protein [Desulfovibrionales bacterium]
MFKKLLFALGVFLLCAPVASAAPKTFAVLPFAVHGPQEYQYLSQGIQSMFTSRLAASDQLAPIENSRIRQAASALPTDQAGADKIRAALHADYLVWGAATIMGQECSLDINTLDASGANQPSPLQVSLNQVIPSLEDAAQNVRGHILGTGPAMAAAPAASAASVQEPVKPISQGIIVNETQANTAYANPSLKYEDADSTMGRWRSPSFPFTSRGMVVCDGDGDGKNEIFIMTESAVIVFQVEGEEMRKVTEFELPKNRNYVRLNTMDLNRDGTSELIIAGVQGKEPKSLILGYANKQLTILTDNIPYHLGVLSLPPTFTPTLVGQKTGRGKYLNSTIYQMIKKSGSYESGPALNLPMGGNVFNVTFLPHEDSYQMIMIDDQDHMRVFSSTGSLLTTSEESYAGSNLGVDYHEVPVGLQAPKSNVVPPDRVFIPLRGIASNLDRDNRFELIISRNISVSAQFFSNYRDYPQGELHSLYWDGVGMSLQWKTARIKGTITDYCLADLNNDGVLDLVVSLNSHTGMAGFAHKKTMILAYPLDLTKTNDEIQKTEQ